MKCIFEAQQSAAIGSWPSVQLKKCICT